MDLKLLQTFLAVVETESFHRAADRLHITQAAVSSRIRALEDILEAELFLRGPGGTRMSDAGKQLRPHAEQLLAHWQQIAGSIGHRSANRIALRVGCQLSIWDSLLVDLTIWAENTLGKLLLTLNFDHESNALDLVRKQIVDMTISLEPASAGRLTSIQLPPERMVLIADHPCSMSDTELPLFINFQLGSQYDAEVHDTLGDHSGHIFLGNAAMGVEYLQRRGGMAFCPSRMVRNALAQERVFLVEGGGNFDINRYAVYDPVGPAAPLVEQILPGLHQVAKDN